MFLKLNQRQFANIVTGDGTWVHYFKRKKNLKQIMAN